LPVQAFISNHFNSAVERIISQEVLMDDTTKKRIRFINSGYETLFFVDDGGEIEIRIDGNWQRTGCLCCEFCDYYHQHVKAAPETEAAMKEAA
jgi:hypothetical protein